jgi:hypothetical protein
MAANYNFDWVGLMLIRNPSYAARRLFHSFGTVRWLNAFALEKGRKYSPDGGFPRISWCSLALLIGCFRIL